MDSSYRQNDGNISSVSSRVLAAQVLVYMEHIHISKKVNIYFATPSGIGRIFVSGEERRRSEFTG